ncbi:MAG: efflux RND transporter periplasmic adaptor subunit [Devosia sp.]
MKSRIILALLLAGGIAAWMGTGTMVISGAAETAEIRPPAERTEADGSPFRVRVRESVAEDRARTLLMRGRTRADAVVAVAAETDGRLKERLVEKGDKVAQGDTLCRLDEGVRAAQLAQAIAAQEQAQLEFDAATKLRGRGFESQTRVAATKAALDAAQAGVAAAERELAHTTVLAPISGIVQDPLAEVGSTLAVGTVCATIVDAETIYVIGQVSERDITGFDVGAMADVSLLTGETATGKITFMSRTADPDTRTFTVEIEVKNDDGQLRDGVTAEARIPLSPVRAHRLSPGVLTLSDDGRVGVRTVDGDNRVRFMPVVITLQDTDGVWVNGLPESITLITVGQDYVIDGQKVEPVAEPRQDV